MRDDALVAKTVKARLFRPPGIGTGTFFILAFDVRSLFGRARPPIRVTINGHTYRSTVAVYGGKYHVVINGTNQRLAGVEAGQTITARIESDTAPRVVRAPRDLADRLAKDPAAREGWTRMSFSHKREIVQALAAAKRPETRARRIEKALRELRDRR